MVRAWVVATRAGAAPVDVDAAMVADGFALVAPGTSRQDALAALAAAARTGRRGLFGSASGR